MAIGLIVSIAETIQISLIFSGIYRSQSADNVSQSHVRENCAWFLFNFAQTR